MARTIDTTKALDVWLRIPDTEEDEAEAEANTYANDDGTYRVEHCSTSVGLISIEGPFLTRTAANAWLALHGYADYSS